MNTFILGELRAVLQPFSNSSTEKKNSSSSSLCSTSETNIILYVNYISIKTEGRKGGRKETECEERMHIEGQKDKVHLVMAIMTDNRRILRARWKKRSLSGSSIQVTLNTNSRLLKDEQKIRSQPLTTKAFSCSCCSLWQDSTTHTPFQRDHKNIPDHQILTNLR